MKADIHPNYKEVTVLLSDGTQIKTRSTLDTKDGLYKPEVDSRNHPFYTKSSNFTSKAGRVDRFLLRHRR